MDSTVVNAIWCAIVVLTIATLTSTSLYKVKKPSKHNETFGKKQEMSRDRTSVESQTLNQTAANFSEDEPNSEQCSLERQDNEPCSKASISDTYTEEQFFRGLSKFIVELTDRCDISEDQHTGDFSKYYPINDDHICKVEHNNDQICKDEHINNDQICIGKHTDDDPICKGKKYKFNDYELTAIYVHYTSYMFKTNFNGRDLVIRYLKYIPCCEDKIIVKAKHENIVEVYHSFYTEDRKGFFIVMEAMDCNLCQYSKQHPDKLKDVVKSVVNALQYLHSNGIAHCNLKLGNILVKTVGGKTVYKLCNFAAAMFIKGDEVIEPENFSYTASYQAPETYFSSKFSAKTDIWLLGHTIWYYIEKDNKFYGTYGGFNSDKYEEYLKSLEECPIRKNRLEIINKCCTIAPEDRASFETILEWCNEEDNRNPCTKMCAKILDFFRLRSISNN